jgi:hypothetical protein
MDVLTSKACAIHVHELPNLLPPINNVFNFIDEIISAIANPSSFPNPTPNRC